MKICDRCNHIVDHLRVVLEGSIRLADDVQKEWTEFVVSSRKCYCPYCNYEFTWNQLKEMGVDNKP